jgi:hypothetical protein
MSIPLTILLGVLRSVRERCLLLLGRSKQENRLYRICCRKSENELSLRHEQFCACECPRALRPFQCFCRGKRRENFFLAKDPRNPLISLDSDERIQGNPKKSNTKKPRFRSGKAIRQENPNGPTGAAARLRCRAGPHPALSKCNTLWGGRFSLAEDARPGWLGASLPASEATWTRTLSSLSSR